MIASYFCIRRERWQITNPLDRRSVSCSRQIERARFWDKSKRIEISAPRGGPAKRPSLRDFTACSRASATSLSTLPHGFALMFPAFRSAGFTEVRAHAADAVSEFRASRKQSNTGPAEFKAIATEPDAFPHHDWIFRQGLGAALRAPADTLQTLFDTSLDDLV